MASNRIPKVIHIIWIGDPEARPESAIDSWRQLNPSYQVKVWGNEENAWRTWRNANHMKEMWSRELAGVADMMRYEILFDEGGFTIDADSHCLRPLDDFLFEHDPFACWESELARPGLIANGFLASSPRSPLIGALIDAIAHDATLADRMAWQSTGPLRLTETVRRIGYTNLTVFPSHFFIPQHFTGLRYTGYGHVYARHDWDSTRRLLRRDSVPKSE